MSIDIKDYRRLHDTDKDPKVAAPVDPIAQVAVEENVLTGHAQLDKLIRALQSDIEATEAACAGLAQKGMGTVQHEMLTLLQFEYIYNKGKIDAWKAAAQLPKRIIAESKLTS